MSGDKKKEGTDHKPVSSGNQGWEDAANTAIRMHHDNLAKASMIAARSTAMSSGRAILTIHEPLPPDHPIYALVGRIASEWARYEGILDAIIWDLCGLQGPTGACVTAQLMSAGPRLVAIRGLLLELRIDASKTELGQIEKRTFDLQVKRNRAVHDPWYWERSSQTTAQLKSKPKNEWVFGMVPVKSETLTDLLQKVLYLSEMTGKLRNKLNELRAPRAS